MAATKSDIVEDLFDAAYQINEEQEALNERRNGVRSSLRSLKSAGVLDADQSAQVEALYPTVTRKRKDDDSE